MPPAREAYGRDSFGARIFAPDFPDRLFGPAPPSARSAWKGDAVAPLAAVICEGRGVWSHGFAIVGLAEL